ncbi:MAG: hypothetical protein INH41_31900 [Myxococcaceae bacterium]|jgi:hypothetical protein|nr:hypothetical protein [Myxococcaceae bacterium]MCA3017011.1 hypothetical protein [Myxococcaceae bacterium]
MHDRLSAVSDECLSSGPRRAGLVQQLTHVFGGLCALYAERGEVGRRFVRATSSSSGSPMGR